MFSWWFCAGLTVFSNSNFSTDLSSVVLLLQFFCVCTRVVRYVAIVLYLFLISISFGASGRLYFVIVAFPGYRHSAFLYVSRNTFLTNLILWCVLSPFKYYFEYIFRTTEAYLRYIYLELSTPHPTECSVNPLHAKHKVLFPAKRSKQILYPYKPIQKSP